MIKLLPLLAVLFFAAPAEAHNRNRHYHYQPQFWFTWQTGHYHNPRQPKIRINEHCVWKPWKNKTVCRY